eukprot:353707-Chlamydomonas_euryale.AAC.11
MSHAATRKCTQPHASARNHTQVHASASLRGSLFSHPPDVPTLPPYLISTMYPDFHEDSILVSTPHPPACVHPTQVVELNSKAVDTAKQAVGLDAGCPLAHIALCVSRGRLALVSDNRTKVQLARDAADDAAEALRLDPHSDLAHHLMGR